MKKRLAFIVGGATLLMVGDASLGVHYFEKSIVGGYYPGDILNWSQAKIKAVSHAPAPLLLTSIHEVYIGRIRTGTWNVIGTRRISIDLNANRIYSPLNLLFGYDFHNRGRIAVTCDVTANGDLQGTGPEGDFTWLKHFPE